MNTNYTVIESYPDIFVNTASWCRYTDLMRLSQASVKLRELVIKFFEAENEVNLLPRLSLAKIWMDIPTPFGERKINYEDNYFQSLLQQCKKSYPGGIPEDIQDKLDRLKQLLEESYPKVYQYAIQKAVKIFNLAEMRKNVICELCPSLAKVKYFQCQEKIEKKIQSYYSPAAYSTTSLSDESNEIDPLVDSLNDEDFRQRQSLADTLLNLIAEVQLKELRGQLNKDYENELAQMTEEEKEEFLQRQEYFLRSDVERRCDVGKDIVARDMTVLELKEFIEETKDPINDRVEMLFSKVNEKVQKILEEEFKG